MQHVLLLVLLLSDPTGGDPGLESRLSARAVLLERSESSATFLVLVENVSSAPIDVPAELAQYISPSWRHAGMVHAAFGSRMCSDPETRGTVTLASGYSYGRREHIRLEPGALAVAFTVDLGGELGRVTTPWVETAKP